MVATNPPDSAAAAGSSDHRHRADGLLTWAPALTLLVMLGPVAAGLIGTLAPALGYLPALGGDALGLAPVRDLLAWPGLGRAATLSVGVGFAATTLSLAIVVAFCAGAYGSRAFDTLTKLLSPLLSVPHAAAAFGVAFLIAPSGWLSRAASPWLTGWTQPPDLLIVQDPAGISLIFGLVSKEVPFLLLMTLAALAQIGAGANVTAARALGYRPATAWLKTVFPPVYRQIRLPLYAVLAFSMSTVDVAIILGPGTPPTLAVQVVRWMNDPDLLLRFRAAAAAVLQLLLVGGAVGVWWLLERIVGQLGARWIERGGRGTPAGQRLLRLTGLAGGTAVAATMFAGLAGLAVWSVAGFWSFPSALPASLTLQSWSRHGPGLLDASAETLLIAACATALALVLAIGCLEAEHRFGLRPTSRALALLYLPLILPQVAFLAGFQTLALWAGVDGGRSAVVAAHLVFVLPYVFLALADPWRGWDRRQGVVAVTLGAGPNRVLWAVRLPMLLGPVLTAAAVGFAVSVGQYLPTLLASGGRVQTLTTEAVALAAGSDRRSIGVYALAQTAAALAPFTVAVLLPRLAWRHRRGMRHD